METKKILALSISLLVIILSVTSIVLTQCRSRPKPDSTRLVTLAGILARETATLVQGTGQIVIVGTDEEWAKDVIPALERSLKERGNSLTVSIEKIKPPVSTGPEDVGLPASELHRILQKYPDATVMVSLVGPPVLKGQDLDHSTRKFPKILVYAPLAMGIKRSLEQGVVQAVVIPRMSPVSSTPSAGRQVEGDPRYMIITPDTISSLPYEPPMPPVPR